MILRNSLIFNVRYMMAQKSDEVRKYSMFSGKSALFGLYFWQFDKKKHNFAAYS